MPPLPPVTKALMLICTAVFCIDLLTPIELWLALFPIGSGHFWPWQLVTYAFLHADPLHLFFNMLGLWMFGAELERLWGQKRYLHMLLASVLAAALVQLVFNYVTGSRAPTVGASGALFGLLLSFGMLFPNRTIMPLFPPIPMKARTFVAVFGAEHPQAQHGAFRPSRRHARRLADVAVLARPPALRRSSLTGLPRKAPPHSRPWRRAFSA
jgi:membrane associated rhomboid family serine protease